MTMSLVSSTGRNHFSFVLPFGRGFHRDNESYPCFFFCTKKRKMAKFNGIKDGDLLFSGGDIVEGIKLAWLIFFFSGIGTFNFISKTFFIHAVTGFWFYAIGIISLILSSILGWLLFRIYLIEGYNTYQGFYLGNRILFKYKRYKLFNSGFEFDESIYLKDVSCFLNKEVDIIDVLFFKESDNLKNKIEAENLTLSGSYKKNKKEVVDFLNIKIKELQIKSSEVEN